MMDLLFIASLNAPPAAPREAAGFRGDAGQAVKDLELRATRRGGGPIHDPAILPARAAAAFDKEQANRRAVAGHAFGWPSAGEPNSA